MYFNLITPILFMYYYLTVCTTMSKGIFGLFAVADRPFESFVYRQTGSTFGMPYLTSGRSVNWTALGEGGTTSTTRLAVNVRPLFDGAMLAVIRHYRWSHVYYIYDSQDGQCSSQSAHLLFSWIFYCFNYNYQVRYNWVSHSSCM